MRAFGCSRKRTIISAADIAEIRLIFGIGTYLQCYQYEGIRWEIFLVISFIRVPQFLQFKPYLCTYIHMYTYSQNCVLPRIWFYFVLSINIITWKRTHWWGNLRQLDLSLVYNIYRHATFWCPLSIPTRARFIPLGIPLEEFQVFKHCSYLRKGERSRL